MVCIHGKTLALSRLTTSISGGQPAGRASLHISCPVHHIAGITSTSGLPTGYGGALPHPLLVPTGGRTQERKSDDFKTFCMWLETHGPFGVIVDGANLAMFGQNNPDGGFDFRQIAAALGHARARHPELKPLVVGRPPSPHLSTRGACLAWSVQIPFIFRRQWRSVANPSFRVVLGNIRRVPLLCSGSGLIPPGLCRRLQVGSELAELSCAASRGHSHSAPSCVHRLLNVKLSGWDVTSEWPNRLLSLVP